MNTQKIIVATALAFILSGAASAEVYKRTNPDGSVEFTDVPKQEKEEAVPLAPMNTFTPPVINLPQSSPADSDSDTQADAKTSYSSLTITEPANDAAIRSNSGDVSVSVSLTPALDDKHTLVLLVDGQQMGDYAEGVFALTNVDRGTHTLTAQVLDEDGKELISAEPVIFHLLRYSAIFNKPRK
jgi:hypothetical protein